MPTHDDAFNHLRLIASQWTVMELDHLLHALKRDRTMKPKLLARYVGRKSAYQVKELLSGVLACPENLLGGHARAVRAESTVDILSQTTKHISPEPYSSVMATSEALMQYADELESKSRHSTNSRQFNSRNCSPREMRFPELYRFLACVMHDRPPPSLSPVESTAVLDLLACVVHVMEQVQCQSEKSGSLVPISGSTHSASNDTSQALWNEVLNKVVDKTGVYLATCAATRWNSLMGNDPSTSQSKQHPVAPLFILDGVQPPKSTRSNRAMVQSVVDRLVQSWVFPKLPDRCYGEECLGLKDLSERDYHLLVKRINAFSLNPFALTLDEMVPLQQLLDTMDESYIVSSVPFEQLLQTADRTAQSGPLIRVDNPEFYSSPSAKNRKRQRKRGSVSSTAKRARTCPPRSVRENSPPPKRIIAPHERPFVRLPDTRNQWQTDRQIKKFINVQFRAPEVLNPKNKKTMKTR